MNGERGGQWRVVLWVVIAVGVGLRVARWGANRSLWLDEIFLANNLLHKSWEELLGKLDYRQGAPPLFLWGEKLAITLFGGSEQAMRLLPLVAGIVAMWLMYEVGERLIGRRGAVVAVALLALTQPAIYYSVEVKQYSTDLMVTLGVMWVGVRWWGGENEDGGWRIEDGGRGGRTVALFAAGLVGMFLSHPAVFVIGAVGGTLMGACAYRGDWRGFRVIVGVAVGWVVAFGVNYVVFLRPLGEDAGLRHHWADGFMPWSGTALPWIAGGVWAVFADYATMWMVWPAVGLVATGIGVMVLARRRVALVMLVGPGVLAMLAAAVHVYPFSGRLLLFLVPTAILLMAAVASADVRGWKRVGQVGLVAVLLGMSAVRAGTNLNTGREEIRAVLVRLPKEMRDGDVLYVAHGAHAGYEYYRGREQWPAGAVVIHGTNIDEDPEAYVKDARDLPRVERLWVLYSHTPAGGSSDARMVAAMGKPVALKSVEAKGAGAYLYDLSGQ